MKVDKETIKKVLDSTADKWNRRYSRLNHIQRKRNMQRRVAQGWFALGKIN